MRQLFAALAATLLLAQPTYAQADAGTPTTTAPAKKPAKTKKKKSKTSRKKKTTRPARRSPAAQKPAAPVQQPQPKVEAQKPAPAQAAEPEVPTVPGDEDAPVVAHTPVTKAVKGKPLQISAQIKDPSGVFQPILFLRRKGMAATEYVPIKMTASKSGPDTWVADIAPQLVSENLEYYIEAYDYAGNGPARAGSPEHPLQLTVEEEKKQVIVAQPPPPPVKVEVKPKGVPPAIAHSPVAHGTKGQPVEIDARLVAESGVSGATVMFRHAGEKTFRALPMANLGGDDWTATIPPSQVTSDLEYYVEAFDKYGNGPARSGAPNAPYVLKVPEPTPVAKPTMADRQPRLEKAFHANPGRALGWTFMAGFIGAGVFAGGEALAAWQTDNAYKDALAQGVQRDDLHDRTNLDWRRARIAGIVAGASLVTSIVLLVAFPDAPDTLVVGAGGDVGFRF